MISHRMSAGFAVPLGADMADGQGLAIGAGNRPGRRYGPGAPARGSRWPARWRASGWCGDGARDTSAVAGLLKRFLVGCAGQRAAARPDPVTEADRVAGVLQVLDRPCRGEHPKPAESPRLARDSRCTPPLLGVSSGNCSRSRSDRPRARRRRAVGSIPAGPRPPESQLGPISAVRRCRRPRRCRAGSALLSRSRPPG